MTRKRKGYFSNAMKVPLIIAWVLVFFASYASAEKKDLPPRGIDVAAEYTGVVVSEGEDVSIDVTVINRGRSDEDIDLKVTSIPKGWKARVKTYSFAVTGVHVESDKSKNLTLKAEPGDQVGPGTYAFEIEARTVDGKLSSTTTLFFKYFTVFNSI